MARSPVRTLRGQDTDNPVDEGGGSSATPPNSGGGSPGPSPPSGEPPSDEPPLSITIPALTVQAGSVAAAELPAPLTSLTEIGAPQEGATPGLETIVKDGELFISASSDAQLGQATLLAAGSGCTQSDCAKPLLLSIPISVIGVQAPPGALEELTEPSPDRVADAVDDALNDELLIALGTPDEPGDRTEAAFDATAIGGVVSGGLDAIGVYEIRWSNPQDLDARRAALESLPGVTAVSSFTLDEYVADTTTPSIDPEFDQPWWTWRFDQIDVAPAWARTDGSDVAVGIIDEGAVFASHPDLNVRETLPGSSRSARHATHVAGLACARGDNQLGMTGIASGCPIVTVGVGGLQGFFAKVLTAMTQMATRPGVEVVNISLGENAAAGCATDFEAEQFQAHAEDAAPMFRHLLAGVGSSIVWTFSAGNNCAPGIPSPWGQSSDLENVITVGATNSDGSLASFSDYGRKVSVVAPGGVETNPPAGAADPCGSPLCFGQMGLLSTTAACSAVQCTAGYGEMMGTSMAAPIVAGVAALVRSESPSLSAEEAGECIKTTAGIGAGYTSGPSSEPAGFARRFSVPASGIPIVNAAAAVECASPPETPTGEPAGPDVVPVDYLGIARTGTHPRISRDGRYVWFESSTDLLPGIRPEGQAVYIRDYVAGTTRRIDLPDVRHDSSEELLAISPSGRYGLVRVNRGIPYLVDQSNQSVTSVGQYLGESQSLGLEDDGDTIMTGPSNHPEGSERGNVVDLFSISTGVRTPLPCPTERYDNEDFIKVNLDNSGFAGVSSMGCRYQASGYTINLATHAVNEVIPGLCNNLGNACVEDFATNETGSDFLNAICCSDFEGHGSEWLNNKKLAIGGVFDLDSCGVSSSGRYAIYDGGGEIRDYDEENGQTTVLAPGYPPTITTTVARNR